MAKRIADGGHEFANHTYTHPDVPAALHATRSSTRSCAVATCSSRLTGGPGAAFRPSGTDDGTASPGDQVLSVAAEAGYATVLGFDVDPLDYDDPGADAVTERTLATVAAGLDREPPLRARGHGRPRCRRSSTASSSASLHAGRPSRPCWAESHFGLGQASEMVHQVK